MVTPTPRRSLVERLRDRLLGRGLRGEQGLALLDVLIGMAIFALIAIIALQALGQYRERAFESTALSDVNAITMELEANFNDAQSYPTTIGVNAATKSYTSDEPDPDGAGPAVDPPPVDLGAHYSKGMGFDATATKAWVRDAATNTYKICVEHTSGTKNDAYAIYNSATGQTTSGRGTGCPVL